MPVENGLNDILPAKEFHVLQGIIFLAWEMAWSWMQVYAIDRSLIDMSQGYVP